MIIIFIIILNYSFIKTQSDFDMIAKPIKDIFKDITQEVSNELLIQLRGVDPLITAVHYMAGHPLEVVNRLVERGKNGKEFDKYPLIALFMDYPETFGNNVGLMEVKLHLMICRGTSNSLITDERFEANFFPILYPIYESFLNKLNTFSYGRNGKPFQTIEVNQIEHTKIDRPFWGRETFLKNKANAHTDYIDAIEIQNLKLLINLNFKTQC